MNPSLNRLGGSMSGNGYHVHLLVAESGGLVTLESPEAVMNEVEFRATHISSLLADMFEECKKHDSFWETDET